MNEAIGHGFTRWDVLLPHDRALIRIGGQAAVQPGNPLQVAHGDLLGHNRFGKRAGQWVAWSSFAQEFKQSRLDLFAASVHKAEIHLSIYSGGTIGAIPPG
jgi:hypothetical protein